MGITVVVTIRGAGILPRMSVEPATQRQAPEGVEALIESMRRGLAASP